MKNAQEAIADVKGGGGTAVAGYEYQMDVSVWLALDLALASKLTNEVELEPGSQEDLEAKLQEFEPGHVTSQAKIDGYQLVVQVKLKSGDAWTVSGVKSLLKHGSDKRVSAAKRLADQKVRYLLVTSAPLNGLTRGLSVRRASVWPNASAMPSSINKVLPSGAAGRVAIVGNFDQERLAAEIKRLLTENFSVPNTRWKDCFHRLREEARVRVCGGGSGRWIREDIERVIREFEGYIASSPELEHYVHPTNWNDLRKSMTERHAAIIIGQSGTGKTLATKKLYEELRHEIPGLAHVPITLGPQQLRVDHTESPVLYDIEDPWGRFDFDPSSRPWNDQLRELLAHARPDRLIIATSRLDVAQSAKILTDVEPWVVRLEAEHYGGRERQKLYRTRIAALPRELQLITKQSEKLVLDELATPLEIQKFFDALPTLDRKGLTNPGKFIRDAIRQAHQTSIERTVIEQIEQRGDVRAAAIIWGLLKAKDKLSLRVLRIIEEGLAERDKELVKGVEPLVSFFVAARNLRQTEELIAYYHPRVEAGIQRVLSEHGLLVRRTLRYLIDILVSLDGQSDGWGTATSAEIITATAPHPELKPTPSEEAQAKIDAWLAKALTTSGKDLEKKLKLAASAGSSGSTVSEVARYLVNRPEKTFFGMTTWKAPVHDEYWYKHIRTDPATKPLVESFIRDVLPNDRDDYGKSFAIEVERIAPDLSDAFLAAAQRVVGYGYFSNSEAIVQGALNDLEGFEEIVDRAIEVLTPTKDELLRNQETRLAIINEEFSEDYADHLSDNDDGYTAGEFLKEYVARVRVTFGWQHLTQHPHQTRLRWYWLRELGGEEAKALPDEIAGVFSVSFETDNEDDLWLVLTKFWDARYREPLLKRVTEGHASEDVRVAALICLIERIPDQIGAIIDNLLAIDDHVRLTQLAIELGHLRIKRAKLDCKDHIAAAESAASNLPTVYQEISGAAFACQADKAPSLSSESQEFLTGLRATGADLRSFRVALNRHLGLNVEDDVRWLLAHSDDDNVAVDAIEAAIRHEMRPEIEEALTHRFAHVSARALTAIAEPLPAPLSAHLLALVEAKGSPVRKALVQLLDKKPHPNHLPTLLVLAKDTWTSHSNYNYEVANFPIAQAALAAIEKLGSLADHAAEELWDVALESRDPNVQYAIFKLLAGAAAPAFQQKLFDLAITPGRLTIRRAASRTLLAAGETLRPELIALITPNLIISRTAGVASDLALLLAWRGEISVIEESGKMLATRAGRRVFILLLILVVKDHNPALTERLTAMLPTNHPSVQWVIGGDASQYSATMLDDLGGPEEVAAVLPYLAPQE